MNIEQRIKDKYKTKYQFAKAHQLDHSLVHYWCTKDWEKMSYKLKERITRILDK